MRRLIYASATLFLLWHTYASGSVPGSLDYYLPPTTQYNPHVPTPESFFGFPPGKWHIRHDRLVEYLRELALTSDRITVEEYGQTYERRPLLLLTITHPENQRRVSDIKELHRTVCSAGRTSPATLESLPVIIWMGFSIHGNEASATNAAPLIAYYLAAAQGPAIDSLLSHTIILLDPCINPDGYGRFSTWVNANRGMQPVSDPQTREHHEPWPSGRTNHYWFDLNRDYLPLVQEESRARMQKYWEWIPHVLLDFHEMGTQSTYFLQPGRPSAIHPLILKPNQTITAQFARACSAALDSIGSLYFTREIFDDFFVGKGSTYPDLSGSVGILFEQASARGHRQENQDGTLEFSFAVRNHVTSALAGVQTTLQLRSDLIRYQHNFFQSALTEGARAPARGYLLSSPVDMTELWPAVDLLLRHHIRIYRLARDCRLDGKVYAADSVVFVPSEQPNFRLLTALMERRKTFSDSIFYDVSSWSLPLAFNLTVAPVGAGENLPIGEPILQIPAPRGSYTGQDVPLAYAFPWSQSAAPKILHHLLDHGIHARVSMRPFAADVHPNQKPFLFEPGTIVVPRGIQTVSPDSLRSVFEQAMSAQNLRLYGIARGLAVDGSDLGSDRFFPVEKAKVLLLAGNGVNAGDAGEMWFVLDRKIGMEVSVAEPSALGRLSLDRYTVVIAPDGTYAGVDSNAVANLHTWIRGGGTLIATENAAEWASKKQLAPVKVVPAKDRISDSTGTRRPFGEMGNAEAAQQVNGAILETLLDTTHPIAFGYHQTRLALSRSTNLVLEPSKDPYATPLEYTTAPLLSGYLTSRNEKALQGTASVVVANSARGRVICFMDNPVFRGYFRGTERLLINAVFFGDLIRSPRTRTPQEID